jgi:hypothetical protein
MTTVIFIHGIGVREPAFTADFRALTDAVRARRPDLTVRPCFWGDPFGSRLRREGASIPRRAQSRGLGDEALMVEPKDESVMLWAELYREPLWELRLLALTEAGQGGYQGLVHPGERLNAAVRALPVSTIVTAAVEQAGLADVFGEACALVMRSDPYAETVAVIPNEPRVQREAIARAIVAQALWLCEERLAQPPDGTLPPSPPILVDVDLRDALIATLAQELAVGVGDDPAVEHRGLGAVTGRAFQLLLSTGVVDSWILQPRRHGLSSRIVPPIGDILLYQLRGDEFRAHIRTTIDLAAPGEPVVLLGHSLGGVMAVDVLAERAQPRVNLVITVGSQAPLLYEIDALCSRRFGQGLPDYFPPWLNIYDPRDLLSYVGQPLFGAERVQDVLVDTGQPFPRSHSAYWSRTATWDAVVAKLAGLGL